MSKGSSRLKILVWFTILINCLFKEQNEWLENISDSHSIRCYRDSPTTPLVKSHFPFPALQKSMQLKRFSSAEDDETGWVGMGAWEAAGERREFVPLPHMSRSSFRIPASVAWPAQLDKPEVFPIIVIWKLQSCVSILTHMPMQSMWRAVLQ